MLGRLLGENVEIATVLASDLGRVKVDPTQIEQVIINLAVNARDAMPAGGRLLIETANVTIDDSYSRGHPGAPPGPCVRLAVTDTGCGMDQQTRERIFEPFFTTKEVGKGTGLGLATVYGIVKQAGGNIFVESEIGRGSTFTIYLPPTHELPSLHAGSKDPGSFEGNGERILVIEDDSAMREVVRDLLQGLGYEVTVAANGGEALLAVEEAGLEPALVITDCVMPGMSGEVVADRLRRTLPDLRILFMSGYTDQGAQLHSLLRRGTPFVQKPFRSAELAAQVRIALSRRDAE
jgi:CheY-like chemotaxis protein